MAQDIVYPLMKVKVRNNRKVPLYVKDQTYSTIVRCDKMYGEWLHIWNELTQTAGHALGYANMVGNTPDLTEISWAAKSGATYKNSLATTANSVKVAGKYLYIPLQFWFCTNPGLALPLIALQYHEVKINLELRDAKDCFWAGTCTLDNGIPDNDWTPNLGAVEVDSLKESSLFVDYVYLDTDERRRFAQVSHEYLISQLQFTGDESTSTATNKFKMSFNHPVKELVWVVQPDDHLNDGVVKTGKQWFNFTDDHLDGSLMNVNVSGASAAGGSVHVSTSAFFGVGENPVEVCKIQLNGHDRFSERDGRYFNLVQPYQHHENVPSKGINVYSFGLQPEGHQPSGTCNMSRIDNATLNVTLTNKTVNGRTCRVKIFAINYNVLRIMSGMGGLAYSN